MKEKQSRWKSSTVPSSWPPRFFSAELTPALDGKEVTVFGWLASIREQRGMIFWIIRDSEGITQVTMHKHRVSKGVLKKVGEVKEHSSVAVRGIVKGIKKAPHGAEIIPNDVKILAKAKSRPPFNIFGGKLPRIDKRLDIRAVDLRRERAQAIFKIRHVTSMAIRDYLSNEGYTEVTTPKIIATATEGGASLFPLLYFNKEAFLAQSPQLYKEQLVMAFEKVFEIGPIFRAEQSRTLRHLSEVTSVDVEEAYVSYVDSMVLIEELVSSVVNAVIKKCKEELKLLEQRLEVCETPFKRLTYDEALRISEKGGKKIDWGEDLSTAAMKALGKVLPEFYFITDWPTHIKPFYIKPRGDRPEVCEAFDLMHGSLEVASGGTRVDSKSMLMKRLRDQGLKPKLFGYHLKIFDYGMPPHAGFGLGLERLMMVLTGQENIREVTIFPRDRSRLTP